MDVNAYLKQVTTASADNGAASELWLRGKKRLAERGGSEDKDAVPKSPKAEAAVGLDMAQVKAALAEERSAAAAERRRRDVGSAQLSEQESAKRAHLVLDYVMVRELGGRHNASRGEDRRLGEEADDMPPSASRLATERAHLTAAAAFSIQHVVHESREGVGAYSEVHRERAPEGVVAYRKSLRVCDVRTDLVGGLTSGMAPHLRAHARRVVEAGLRGEAWVRKAADHEDTHSQHAVAGAEAAQASAGPIVLFADRPETAPGPEDGATFSLDQFLTADLSAGDE